MECEGVLEFNVEITSVSSIVGGMNAVAEIATDDDHTNVDTQADACAEGKITQESLSGEQSAGTIWIVFKEPYVTGINKDGTVEHTHDRKAVFGVELELERTGLVEVSVDLFFRRTVTARTKGPDGEGSDGVGSSDIELLGVGYFGGISVGMFGTDKDSRHEPVFRAGNQTAGVDKLHLTFDKLREGSSEKFLLAFHTGRAPYAAEDVAGFGERGCKVNAVDFLTFQELVESVGIGKLRDELALETEGNRRILIHDAVEIRGGLHELSIRQFEKSELVEHVAERSPLIGIRCVELRDLEIVRTVEDAGIERDVCPVEIAVGTGDELGSQESGEGQRCGQTEFVTVEYR